MIYICAHNNFFLKSIRNRFTLWKFNKFYIKWIQRKFIKRIRIPHSENKWDWEFKISTEDQDLTYNKLNHIKWRHHRKYILESVYHLRKKMKYVKKPYNTPWAPYYDYYLIAFFCCCINVWHCNLNNKKNNSKMHLCL